MIKHCPRCKIDKDLSEFYKAKERKDGYRSTCKSCCSKQNKDYIKRNGRTRRSKEDIKRNTIKARYGISLEEYELVVNNKYCAICNKEAKLFLDHCHSSGKIRGGLCLQCNSGLGMFKDDLEILKSAIKYLKETLTSA